MGPLPIAFLIGGLTVLAFVAWLKVAGNRSERAAWNQAMDLVANGETAEGAMQRLANEGVILQNTDFKKAAELLRRKYQVRCVSTGARELLVVGAADDEIQRKLIAQGHDPRTVKAIVGDMMHPPWARRHPGSAES